MVSSVNGTLAENTATDSGIETAAEGSSKEEPAVEVGTPAAETTEASPCSSENPDVDNRTFTVTGLRHPGAWRTHSEARHTWIIYAFYLAK